MMNKDNVDKTLLKRIYYGWVKIYQRGKDKGPAKRKCSKTSVGKSTTGRGTKIDNKDA